MNSISGRDASKPISPDWVKVMERRALLDSYLPLRRKIIAEIRRDREDRCRFTDDGNPHG